MADVVLGGSDFVSDALRKAGFKELIYTYRIRQLGKVLGRYRRPAQQAHCTLAQHGTNFHEGTAYKSVKEKFLELGICGNAFCWAWHMCDADEGPSTKPTGFSHYSMTAA